MRGLSRQLRGLLATGGALAALPGTVGAQTTEMVQCLKDPSSIDCLAVPGGTRAPPPQWSLGVSGGIAPRDGGPTGSYESLTLLRQLGRSYVQLGATHYYSQLDSGVPTVSSTYGVGTIGFGGNYNNWVLDTYISYGRQNFGPVRFGNLSRPSTNITNSAYWAGGVSFGRMMAVSPRFVITPTASATYAWSRLLRPTLGSEDFNSSEPTWTAAARLRLDWVPGHNRKSYIGLGAGLLWSNNATSLIAGSSGWGGIGQTGDKDTMDALTSSHVHDVWFEIGPHASLAVTRSLRVEAIANRSFGLISGNGSTVTLGLRHSF
ncbi:MAG: hypothetical protein KGJ57_14195 [Sphingomonadales bacterium]|nr:hypothetical protein [Sphingomonadales bacterium]MDE2170556.1 hypothetical protein [Sphingomonadales bacterium]